MTQIANPIRREVIIGDCRLLLGDCLDILPTLGRVDAVVTSPPYGQQRDYGSKISDWRSLVSGAICPTPHHSKTQVLVNLGLVHRDGEVIPYWQPFIDDMKAAGWRHFGWYVWDKQGAMAGDWNGRLAPAHEWIFHFNKQAIAPNKVVQTKRAGQIRHTSDAGLRKPDGTIGGWTHVGKPTLDFKIPDSVIRLYPHMNRSETEILAHPAVYPVLLPKLLVDTYTQPGDVVLDPFLGSGTTLVACAQLGRRGIGIEIDEGYFEIACERIRKAYAQPDMFIERAPEPKQEALL